MHIEGAIATAGMISQQANPVDTQPQRDRAPAAQVAPQAPQTLQQGDNAHAVGQQMLSQAVSQVSKILETFSQTTEFKIHKDTKSTIVTVVDKETGEVLREFPSEKFLDLVAMFQQQLSGLLVDTNR